MDKDSHHYVVATIKSWNIDKFKELTGQFPGTWTLVSDKKDLTKEKMAALNPRYIFFPHWSWIVPKSIYENYECVCFHMTDVPYGRGGSPLQNLIVRGHTDTKLTALRMVSELDAGPVYLKKDLSLAGTAQDILRRASDLIWDSIPDIAKTSPAPKQQSGDITPFKRRKPSDGSLQHCKSLSDVYDYIRMLDAEGYPNAFLDLGGFSLQFDRAVLKDGTVEARVKFKLGDEDE